MENEQPVDAELSNVVRVISQWRLILNARLLAMLSLIGAMVIFGFVMYDPSNLRLWGASLYSVGVLWPIFILYARKG